MPWDITGDGLSLSSSIEPLYSVPMLSWQCANAAGSPFLVLDPTKAMTITEVMDTSSALSALAALRYAKETSGVYFAEAGATVAHLYATDPVSQATLAASFSAAKAGLWAAGSVWKCGDGTFVTLTAADVEAVGAQAQAFVQSCFNNEAALAAQITAGTSPDTSAGWPNNGASDAYTLTGPATATAGAAITLTLQANHYGPASAATITLSDGGAGGTFAPATVDLAALSNAAQTATYTAKTAGSVSISATNSAGLTNPAALAVTVAAAS